MGKGRRNQRNPDYYKVQGGAVEDRDKSRASKQKLAGQKARKGRRNPSPADVHPATPRRVGKKRATVARTTIVAGHPSSRKPAQPAGAALSRLTRRLFSAAEWSIGALRWAGHVIQTARGRSRNE